MVSSITSYADTGSLAGGVGGAVRGSGGEGSDAKRKSMSPRPTSGAEEGAALPYDPSHAEDDDDDDDDEE